MPTTLSKAPRAARVPALNPNEERPENCYCSSLPNGSGPCVPCYGRRLRLAEARLAVARKSSRLPNARVAGFIGPSRAHAAAVFDHPCAWRNVMAHRGDQIAVR